MHWICCSFILYYNIQLNNEMLNHIAKHFMRNEKREITLEIDSRKIYWLVHKKQEAHSPTDTQSMSNAIIHFYCLDLFNWAAIKAKAALAFFHISDCQKLKPKNDGNWFFVFILIFACQRETFKIKWDAVQKEMINTQKNKPLVL